jgi:hypothetical protein
MCELTEEDIQRGLLEPLVIYPRGEFVCYISLHDIHDLFDVTSVL